jgi:hypothetical protein
LAAGHTVLYPIYFDAKCAHSMAAALRIMHAKTLEVKAAAAVAAALDAA